LIELLTGLPSIGRKSAWRLALYLLDRPEERWPAFGGDRRRAEKNRQMRAVLYL
jgi:recombinational DNA repair protein RecR